MKINWRYVFGIVLMIAPTTAFGIAVIGMDFLVVELLAFSLVAGLIVAVSSQGVENE
jgi:hypothetical protein